ncbi:MAG TPA: polyamine aminopropyltransferase [Chitinispirillaceae bacterium]|jgi:spermidine synthase|nr:polyamine aminopropyltransferase [Chitinispirillaceae bacterium]
MQKHIRTVIKDKHIKQGRNLFIEALNPYFGYFYTVRKSLVKSKTKYQNIELIDTDEFGKVLLLDNITQVVEKNEYHYHEPMVHPAMCSHSRPESVLVIGGGDGGIVREVLKYPVVKRVELAELDEDVIKFSRKYLTSVHAGSFDDPRVTVNIVDGRKFTETHPGEFDIIIMDMTDPFGPSRMLYTRDFFRSIKRALRNPGGIFVMHSESPVARPAAFASIQKTLSSVFKNVNPFFLYIQMYAVLWSITLSSESVDPSKLKPAAIDKKLTRYGIKNLQVYTGDTHHSMLTRFPYIGQITKKQGRIITDAKPDFPDDFLS